MNFKRLTIATITIATITLSGCGKIAEKATEKATEKIAEKACKDGQSGEDCEVDISKDGVQVNTDDGSFSSGENTDYPDGYPDYLKVDGTKPMSAIATGDGAMNVTLVGDVPGSEVVATLERQATDAGCTTDDEIPSAGVGFLSLNCSEGTVILMNLSDPDTQEQGVSITVTPEQ